MTSQSRQNFRAAAIVAIIALLGLNIFQFFSNRSLSKVNEDQETELVTLEQARAELEKEYYQARSSLEELKSSNSELNELIGSQQEELKEQKERISRLLRDSRALAKAKDEIAAMKDQAEIYVSEIKKLKEENAQLAQANESLNEENQNLSTTLTTVREENDELNTAKNALLTEKEVLSKEKSALKTKVDEATVVPAMSLEVDGIFYKDVNSIRKTSRANKSEAIQVCFETGINELTEKGTETFHFRVIDPIGETISVENAGSGVFYNLVTDQQMRYSFTRSIDYNRDEVENCFVWNPNIPLQSGTYEIEVYNKGFLAGKETFKLR